MAKRLCCPFCNEKLEFFKNTVKGLGGIYNFKCSCKMNYKAYFQVTRKQKINKRQCEEYFVGNTVYRSMLSKALLLSLIKLSLQIQMTTGRASIVRRTFCLRFS